jgi:DNA-binding response OmpR family regulator
VPVLDSGARGSTTTFLERGIGDVLLSYRVTPLESRLLQLLISNAGQPVATDQLLRHIWGERGGGDRQPLKQLVHRLRQKMGDKGDHAIETVTNVGY